MTTTKKSAAKLDDAYLVELAKSALEAIAKLPVGASDSGNAQTARQIAQEALAGMGREN